MHFLFASYAAWKFHQSVWSIDNARSSTNEVFVESETIIAANIMWN